ncbi:hypothetical protein SAMN05216258_10630 [Albimonas pacifica]|uniref:Uncharacterized protein n=1 Tax=Albimonas pacifica TaxID=1114924 RepID=A0A1I3HJM7_9RHOB|nr:hypothetical protein SAMN05216258_10630 [Albimonas pacifica]
MTAPTRHPLRPASVPSAPAGARPACLTPSAAGRDPHPCAREVAVASLDTGAQGDCGRACSPGRDFQTPGETGERQDHGERADRTVGAPGVGPQPGGRLANAACGYRRRGPLSGSRPVGARDLRMQMPVGRLPAWPAAAEGSPAGACGASVTAPAATNPGVVTLLDRAAKVAFLSDLPAGRSPRGRWALFGQESLREIRCCAACSLARTLFGPSRLDLRPQPGGRGRLSCSRPESGPCLRCGVGTGRLTAERPRLRPRGWRHHHIRSGRVPVTASGQEWPVGSGKLFPAVSSPSDLPAGRLSRRRRAFSWRST